jgi:hypothetical protein
MFISHEQKVRLFRVLLAGEFGAHLYMKVLHLLQEHRNNADDTDAIFQALSEMDWRFSNVKKRM